MYVGVDVGGTKTLAALFDEGGSIVRKQKLPTPDNYQEFILKLTEAIQVLIGNDQIKAIGLGVPGVMDYDTGIVRRFGNRDWQDADIKSDLSKQLDMPIVIDNDANFGALGEANIGAGKDYRVMLYVTISTGIGTGVTVNGQIDPVLARSEAGQMHFRHEGKLMRWEHFASGKAFLERFGKMGKDTDDPETWRAWSEDISLGMGSLMAIIQPNVIVVGGSMGEHLHKYHDFLIEALENVRSPLVDIPPVVQAHDVEHTVLFGCYIGAKAHAEHR